MQSQQIEQIVQKLRALTPNCIDEVEDFIDYLSQRDIDGQWTKATTVSKSRLKTLWDNPYDAEYDNL